MINIIYIVISWGVSILVAWGTIRQSKGTDWYNPITNKHKMVMIVINTAIFIIIPDFFLELLLIRKFQCLIYNIIFGVLSIAFLIYMGIKLHKLKPDGQKSDDDKNKSQLRKLIERFLTVFNIIYFLCTIIYAVVYSSIYYHNKGINLIDSLYDFMVPVAEIDNTLVVSLSLIFWLALITAIVTLNDWRKSDDDNNSDYEQPRSYDFFCSRVKKRGRKD